MNCVTRGPFHTGLSPEACSNANGHWFPTPCITLQRCVDNRPFEDDDYFNEAFELWVVQSDAEIYDASDQDQCTKVRVALGYDAAPVNDNIVCDSFNELMCDTKCLRLLLISLSKLNSNPTGKRWKCLVHNLMLQLCSNIPFQLSIGCSVYL